MCAALPTKRPVGVLKYFAVQAKSNFAFTCLYHYTLSASQIKLNNAEQAQWFHAHAHRDRISTLTTRIQLFEVIHCC
jgi:hypothetical protein